MTKSVFFWKTIAHQQRNFVLVDQMTAPRVCSSENMQRRINLARKMVFKRGKGRRKWLALEKCSSKKMPISKWNIVLTLDILPLVTWLKKKILKFFTFLCSALHFFGQFITIFLMSTLVRTSPSQEAFRWRGFDGHHWSSHWRWRWERFQSPWEVA